VLHRTERARLLADELGPRVPVVDGYAVGEELGSGGSGQVWAGTGPDGQRRALKVLHPGGAGPEDLLRELALLRRVRHPRVVAVHDISRDAEGRPVLVLDLAAGGSLAGLLRTRRRLGAAEVVGLLSALGPALEELHAAGVVHGDLSPGNVLLDARGEPLLADLGLARALGRRPGSVLGTPGFADPAALAGDPGAAGDVYGLAAVCWCALTGAPPPAGRRRPGRRAAGQLPPGTSQDLLAVLRSGLHPRPSRRPTPGELAEAAAACARPRPLRLPPPVAPAPAGRGGPGTAGAPGADGLVPRGVPASSATSAGSHRLAAPLPGPRPAAHPDLDVHAVTRELRAAAGAASATGSAAGAADGPAPAVGPAPPGRRAARVSAGGPAAPATGASRRRAARPPAAAGARRRRRVLLVGVPVLVLALAGGVLLRHEGGTEPAATGGGQPLDGRDVEAAPAADPTASASASAGVPSPGSATSGSGTPGAAATAPRTSGPVDPGAAGADADAPGGAATDDVGAGVLAGDDVPAAVRELAARRAAALAGGDPGGLLAVDADGSAALAADTAVLAQLRTAGLRWSGLSFDVGDVRVAEASATRAVVLADVVTGAHEVVGGDGSSTPVAAAAPRTSRLTLLRVAGQWRVEAVG